MALHIDGISLADVKKNGGDQAGSSASAADLENGALHIDGISPADVKKKESDQAGSSASAADLENGALHIDGISPADVKKKESDQAGSSASAADLENGALHIDGILLADVKRKESDQAGSAADLENGLLKRVENLVWIKGNTYYREALSDWEQQKKSLGGKLERREKRVEELTNQVYNLVGFFSVFQGVILTAVTQLTQTTPSPSEGCSPRSLCNKVWFPVTLSILAAVAAVFGIGLKFRDLHSTDNTIRTYKLDLTEAEKRESQLQSEGERFLFKELKEPPPRSQKSYWLLKAGTVIGGVIAFTLIFVLSYFAILCDKFVS